MALTQKIVAVMALEDVNGTFKTPTDADKNFPLSCEVVSPETSQTEGARDANGKISRGRFYPNGTEIPVKLSSTLMEAVDPTALIEISPLLQLGGFNIVDNGTSGNKDLVFDGSSSCNTASMRVVNLDCSGTSGYGWDIRGLRSSIQIVAESAGSVFTINADLKGALEAQGDNLPAIGINYTNDANLRNNEMLTGAVTIDGVATAINGLDININAETKVKKDPSKTGQRSYSKSTDYDPKVSITAPVGVDTTGWWDRVASGGTIDNITYAGIYYDIIIEDLSIASFSVTDDEGELANTQELSFGKITLAHK